MKNFEWYDKIIERNFNQKANNIIGRCEKIMRYAEQIKEIAKALLDLSVEICKLVFVIFAIIQLIKS